MYKIKRIKTLKTIGGKANLLVKLLPIIHFILKTEKLNGFLDLFGGGNKFIPQINRFSIPVRVYNELDKGISDLMACMADRDKAREVINLAYRLQKEYKTEKAFHEARERKRSKETSMIESAALTIIIAEFSRAADRVTFCKENAERGISYRSLKRYMELVPIMQDVIITCASYEYIFKIYAHRSDFMAILDPPYTNSNCYEDSFPDWLHEEMVKLIVDTKMKVILCGTDTKIYDYLLEPGRGWYKYTLGDMQKSSTAKKGEVQEEFIWTSFPIPSYLLPRQCKKPFTHSTQSDRYYTG